MHPSLIRGVWLNFRPHDQPGMKFSCLTNSKFDLMQRTYLFMLQLDANCYRSHYFSALFRRDKFTANSGFTALNDCFPVVLSKVTTRYDWKAVDSFHNLIKALLEKAQDFFSITVNGILSELTTKKEINVLDKSSKGRNSSHHPLNQKRYTRTIATTPNPDRPKSITKKVTTIHLVLQKERIAVAKGRNYWTRSWPKS